MKIQFSDYKNGGDLFTLTEDQVDVLDSLNESPLQVWVDGNGCDVDNLVASKGQLLGILRAHRVRKACPPYWNEEMITSRAAAGDQ